MNTNKHFLWQCLLLLAVLLPTAQQMRAAILLNNTYFPDPAFRSYISEKTGIEIGGFISNAELESITDMYDLEGRGIKNLKGIEYFTNLTIVNASYNELTTVNVSSLTKLEHLILRGCSLTSLDVTHNVNLQFLRVEGGSTFNGTRYNNYLTELDVSKCTELKGLICEYNKLTKLDVTKNTKLIELRCMNNKLRQIDLSQCVELEEFSCSNNMLSNISLSNCTKLKNLYCDGNELAYLSVDNNPLLERLVCSNNQLTYLNLENNPNITNWNGIFYGNSQQSTRRFQRMSYLDDEHTCWALYVGTSDASRIKNLKIDNVSKTPVMLSMEGWMMVSDDLKHIPLKVTYDYDTRTSDHQIMKDIEVNYHVINYGVYVDGVELTSLNLNNIPGLKSGTAYVNDEPQWIGWAGNPTLVLYNAEIEGEEGISNETGYWFHINVRGNNTVTATDYNALNCEVATSTTLSGGGRLHVRTTNNEWNGVYLGDVATLKITDGTRLWADGDGYGLFDDCGRLTIDASSTLAAYGRFHASVELPSEECRTFGEGIDIRYPEGATIGAGYHVYYKNSTADVQRDWVVIGPSTAQLPTAHHQYGLTICGYAVDEVNASDIARDDPGLMSGDISFDADTHTLTLKNAHLKDIKDVTISTYHKNPLPDFHIKLEGNNVMDFSSYTSIASMVPTYIEGPGKLETGVISMSNSSNLYIRDNCAIKCICICPVFNTAQSTLTVSGEDTRVEVDGGRTVLYAIQNFSQVYLKDGLEVREPAGGYYDTTTRKLVDADGNPVKKAVIASPAYIPTDIPQMEVADESAPVYNLQGQRVGDDYKGIVIKNGKKVRQ